MKIKYKTVKYFTLLVVIVAISVAGCGKKEKKMQQAPPKLPVIEVIKQDVPVMKEFVGQIYGYQDITIRARVEGFLEGIHFKEGTRVKKGQLLYSIDPQPFKAKVAAQLSNVAEAKTMMVKAKSDLDRIRPLAENNAVSKADLDAAVAQYEAAQAAVEAAKANLEYAQIELSYTEIKSPINGIIGKTQATVGDFVGRSPNPVVLNTVSNLENVLVEFFLSESEYLTIARELIEKEGKITQRETGNRAEISLWLSDEKEYDQKGYITFLDRGVNPSTGTLLIQAEFPNPDRILRPGQFARVVVKMNELKDAELVPQQAVNEIQGDFNVFIVDDSSKVEIRPIKIQMPYKDYYVVEDGLSGNEKIILEGLQKVRGGMPVQPELTTYTSKQKNKQ